MITIQGILAKDAPHMWPVVSDWCEGALEYAGGLMNLDDVKAAVAKNEMQMWVVMNASTPQAVCITEIRRYPRANVLTAILIGGTKLHKWAAQLDSLLTRFATANNCKFVDGYGRKGWEKIVNSLGWARRATIYMKRV